MAGNEAKTFERLTSLVEAAQTPLMIDQRTVIFCPAVKPVTVEVGLLGVVMVAPFVAPMIDQVPVPTEGVFPAKVNVPLPHCTCPAPALAVVGAAVFVKTTSLVEGGQNPLKIDQRNVTEAPTVKPETVELARVGALITAPFAAPTTLQSPFPIVGTFAAKVKLPLLHCV